MADDSEHGAHAGGLGFAYKAGTYNGGSNPGCGFHKVAFRHGRSPLVKASLLRCSKGLPDELGTCGIFKFELERHLLSDEVTIIHFAKFVDARRRNHLVQKLRQVGARVACKNMALPIASLFGADLERMWQI
jgi:hypothetical protein